MYNNSIINIRFIYALLFVLEVRYIVGYSSNIYFFFLFLLVIYIFFYFFSNVISLYEVTSDLKKNTYTLASLFYINIIRQHLILKLFFFNILFKYILNNYKVILHNKIISIWNRLKCFFIYVKNIFVTNIFNVIA